MYTSGRDSTVLSPCACTAVKKLSRLLGRVYDAALAPSGINVTQFAVMRSIARHNGEPLTRVARELQMDRTSLYRAIAPMQRDGWVKLSAGIDARSRSAKVTHKGEKVLAGAAAGWELLQQKLIGTFGQAEWHRLDAELRRLADCAAAQVSDS